MSKNHIYTKIEIQNILENIKIQKSLKTQCNICNGHGLVKKDPIVCHVCSGIKCMSCKETGFIQLPYETCELCDGLGEYIK